LNARIAEATADVAKLCGTRDARFSTRDYAGMDISLAASCMVPAGSSICMKARCSQERLVFDLMLVDGSDGGQRLHPDKTLAAYRAAMDGALRVDLHEIYQATHPISSKTPFFVFIPAWAFVFGARLSRPVAEIVDPDGNMDLAIRARMRRCLKWILDLTGHVLSRARRRRPRRRGADTRDSTASPP